MCECTCIFIMYYTHLKTTSPLPVVDVDAKFIVQDHLHDPVEVGTYVRTYMYVCGSNLYNT